MDYFLESKVEGVDRIVQTCLDVALKHNKSVERYIANTKKQSSFKPGN